MLEVTDQEIADYFCVSWRTLLNYKNGSKGIKAEDYKLRRRYDALKAHYVLVHSGKKVASK